jgi:predicted dehydrogenase
MVEGRQLDDDANILIRFENGAKGVITVSQVAAGEENELKIKVYGELGGLEWLQSNPNSLILKITDEPKKILKTGSGNTYLSNHALVHTRLPGGHPEGYIESLANIYRNFAMAIHLYNEGKKWRSALHDFPTITDGMRGMKFIEAAIESGKNNSKWTTL